jgi:hypothetical protein
MNHMPRIILALCAVAFTLPIACSKRDRPGNTAAGDSEPAAADQPVIGRLGKPVGTELTLEGTFVPGKGAPMMISKINDKKLSSPVVLQVSNPANFSGLRLDTVYRFKGKETTFVVASNPQQQISSGRHFELIVTEVLAPEEAKSGPAVIGRTNTEAGPRGN